jgi:DNA-binding NarL/FixJ family response regulator
VTIRIALVEDNPRYRRGLEALFAHAGDFEVCGGFADPRVALERARQAVQEGNVSPWDLMLMDLQLPGLSGIEATGRFKELLPEVLVVVLTVFEEPETVLRAICAGADGYLLKSTPSAEILEQVRAVAAGGSTLTAGVARTVLDMMRRYAAGGRATNGDGLAAAPPSRLGLTEREQDVLRGLVRGLSYKLVARDLGVGVETVRTHVRGIYRKLQVHTATEAVARAVRERLV